MTLAVSLEVNVNQLLLVWVELCHELHVVFLPHQEMQVNHAKDQALPHVGTLVAHQLQQLRELSYLEEVLDKDADKGINLIQISLLLECKCCHLDQHLQMLTLLVSQQVVDASDHLLLVLSVDEYFQDFLKCRNDL